MGLSRYEQEVVINFNAEEDTASIYTANPVWIRKMDKLVEQNSEEFHFIKAEKAEGKVISKKYDFPKRLLTIRSKTRTGTMSEEQRQAASERLRKIRA